MAKQPPLTFQQRLWFHDSDLLKPEHEQIQFWLAKTAPTMLPEWLNLQQQWPQEQVDRFHHEVLLARDERIGEVKRKIESLQARSNHTGAALSFLQKQLLDQDERSLATYTEHLRQVESLDVIPPSGWPPVQVGSPEWEPIIYKGHGSNASHVGSADMRFEYSVPRLEPSLGQLRHESDSYRLESALRGPIDGPQYFRWSSHTAYFEVKTEIKNFSELMRQLQLYRFYTKGEWFVVSPDTRFKGALAEQGIHFVEYEPSPHHTVP